MADEAVPARAWRVLAVTAIGVFVVFLDTTIVNIAFSAISEDFDGSSPAALSWILNAYSITFAALLVTAGRLADLHGRRRLFLGALVAFAATSALCGLAPNVGLLIAGRALQAVAAAALVPTSLALLLPEFPASRRAMAVGLWGACGALAAATGPTVGALLLQGPGWPWVFGVNVPVCALAVVMGARVLTESRDPEVDRRLDLLGVALVSAAMASVALAIVQGPEWGWADTRVLAAFGAGAVLAPLFVLRCARFPAPIVDLGLFGSASFSVANVATLVFATGFFASILNNVLFLTRVWGFSPLETGLAVSPGPVLAAALSGPAGRMADRHGHRVVIVPGALLYAAAQVWFLTRVGSDPAYVTEFLPGFLLLGVGIGLTFSTLGGASAASLPPQRFAIGSAVNATARQIGAVLGISGLIAILGTTTGLAAAERAWTAILLTALATGAVALLLPARPRAATTAVTTAIAEPALAGS